MDELDLDGRIAALEARIAKYEAELDAASTAQEKTEIRQTINSRSETLNLLLDKKMAQTSSTNGQFLF
jgi:hypothetical protein